MKRSVLNKVLLLRLMELAPNVNSFRKVTQLVYILQEEGRKEKRVTFNYEFRKWHYEPYSAELEKDLQQMDWEGLIEKKEMIRLTEKGQMLSDKMSAFYEDNKTDDFLKFFAYLHVKETLYETTAYINERYGIAKYPTDSVIVAIEERVAEEAEDIHVLKSRIDKRLQELEEEDVENWQKAAQILSDETTA